MTFTNFRLPTLSLGILAFCLQACDESSSSPAPVVASDPAPEIAPQSPLYVYDSATWAVRGDLLVLDYIDSTADTGARCGLVQELGNSWRSELYKLPYLALDRDSQRFVQVGDDLVTYPANDTAGWYSVSRSYRRVGTGSGLVGEWREVRHRLRDSAGWTDLNRIELAKLVDVRLEFTEKTYRWVERPLLTWADAAILRWTQRTRNDRVPSQGELYDIEISKVDEEAVRFRGLRTGEVVVMRRIRVGSQAVYTGDLEFSSSIPTHSTWVDEEFPVSCPDDAWWHRVFLEANLKLPVAPPDPPAIDSSGIVFDTLRT